NQRSIVTLCGFAAYVAPSRSMPGIWPVVNPECHMIISTPAPACPYPVCASVLSDRSAQDRSKAKPDEVVQTPVVRLSGRAASRATNTSAVRAAEILLTHRAIWKFAD